MLYTSLFALLFAFLAYHLPDSVPVFLGIMAMPPHVDEGNLSTFCAVLLHRRSAEMQDLLARVCGAAMSRQGTPFHDSDMRPDETEECDDGPISFAAVRELWSANAPPATRPTTAGLALCSAGATVVGCGDGPLQGQQGLAANEERASFPVISQLAGLQQPNMAQPLGTQLGGLQQRSGSKGRRVPRLGQERTQLSVPESDGLVAPSPAELGSSREQEIDPPGPPVTTFPAGEQTEREDRMESVFVAIEDAETLHV
mmetsp:Transcript_93764/g.236288  ORF Transcript_93764/g.236288 Transcript_93764/m.236288 type:complete len:256 (+) Transcript_93764:2-769(+)